MKIGDIVKVKGQNIFGRIIFDYGNEIILEDKDAETEDNQLYFKKSELEIWEVSEYHKKCFR